MEKIKVCIFDLDGVIVDSAKFHFKAWKRLANEIGVDFTEEDNERLKGVSRKDSLDIILELGKLHKTAEEKDQLCVRKNNWFVEYIQDMDSNEILPGVSEFIVSLKENGFLIALGSSSKNARKILQKVGLIHHFDALIDGTDITHAKPNPEIFLKGASALGVEPEKCCVFEDATSGIEAAKNANMFCIGVGDSTILHQADFCIKTFTEMSISRLP